MWLVLAGDGPMRGELQALADSSGVALRVRFLGWTEDLSALYATFDICALSSVNEGTPVAIDPGDGGGTRGRCDRRRRRA